MKAEKTNLQESVHIEDVLEACKNLEKDFKTGKDNDKDWGQAKFYDNAEKLKVVLTKFLEVKPKS